MTNIKLIRPESPATVTSIQIDLRSGTLSAGHDFNGGTIYDEAHAAALCRGVLQKYEIPLPRRGCAATVDRMLDSIQPHAEEIVADYRSSYTVETGHDKKYDARFRPLTQEDMADALDWQTWPCGVDWTAPCATVCQSDAADTCPGSAAQIDIVEIYTGARSWNNDSNLYMLVGTMSDGQSAQYAMTNYLPTHDVMTMLLDGFEVPIKLSAAAAAATKSIEDILQTEEDYP